MLKLIAIICLLLFVLLSLFIYNEIDKRRIQKGFEKWLDSPCENTECPLNKEKTDE